MSATALIAHSESHDTIAHADYTPELAAVLEDLCDGSSEIGGTGSANEGYEYWANGPGETDMKWRVHLHRAGASECDRCGEVVADIDAGFSPGLHAMAHDCGGTWRLLNK